MALVGIDAGSSAVKCLVLDERGAVLAESLVELPRRAGEGELDPDALWDATRLALEQALSRSPDRRIEAIGVSSFGESFVAVDRDGGALAPVLLYTDPRGAEELPGLVAAAGIDHIRRTAGVEPLPMYSLPKILRFRRRFPDLAARTWKYLPIGSFLVFRLCGATAIDPSLAARTMALDVIRHRWDPDLLAAAGIGADLLPDLVPPATAVGRLDPVLAAQVGIRGSPLVIPAGHDQVCAAMGAGVVAPGQAVDGTGSVECITPVFGRPVLDPAFLGRHFACVPHAVPGLFVTYAFNFTGGALLKWYRDTFADSLKAEAAARGTSAYALLDERASPEPSTVLVVPHFAGSGTPDMEAARKGAFLGLTFGTTQGDLYRGLLEGVALELRYNLEILEAAGIPIRGMRAVGGGARSALWLSIKASIFGCPVQTLETQEAGASGAAMLAGIAAGSHADARAAADAMVRVTGTVDPEPALEAHYNRRYALYRDVRAAMPAIS